MFDSLPTYYTDVFERTPMQPHQERVVAEKKDLDEKIDKLRDFIRGPIYVGLPVEERGRLRYQRNTMECYSDILSDRIAAF